MPVSIQSRLPSAADILRAVEATTLRIMAEHRDTFLLPAIRTEWSGWKSGTGLSGASWVGSNPALTGNVAVLTITNTAARADGKPYAGYVRRSRAAPLEVDVLRGTVIPDSAARLRAALQAAIPAAINAL